MNRVPRILLLVAATFWVADIFAFQLAMQRALGEEMRALDSRVAQAERDRAVAAIVIEARLSRIETQLATMNETINKAIWGGVGTMLLVVVNALLGLVIRKPAVP